MVNGIVIVEQFTNLEIHLAVIMLKKENDIFISLKKIIVAIVVIVLMAVVF